MTCEARKIRVEYEGGIYRLMNRGDRREPIFKGDPDRELFLETLAQTCAKTSIKRCAKEGAETQTKRAEGIIVEELKTRRWMEKELRKRPKRDGDEVTIARRLRAETVMTASWISQRLHWGSRNYSNLLLSKSGE